jgi:uncharacterized C2H2 Zn-finger protein
MKHISKNHPDKLQSTTIKAEAYLIDEDTERIYICPHCQFAVGDKRQNPMSSITSHVANHTRSTGSIQSSSFKTSNDKKLIQAYIKGEVENELFRCPICKDILGVPKDLLKHLSHKHSKADLMDVSYKTIKLIKDYLLNLPQETKKRLNIK